MSQISLKNSFGKLFFFVVFFLFLFVCLFVFLILTHIEITRTKNRLFGRYFETVQHFDFFPGIMVFDSA